MDQNKVFQNSINRFATGFALSKALLEDYAKVIAKLEGTSEEEVTDRVRRRADEIIQEIKDEAGQALEK